MDELDFNKILTGDDQSHKKPSTVHPTEKKFTHTDTRTRQQSCMIN
jgi:hypothetical protein